MPFSGDYQGFKAMAGLQKSNIRRPGICRTSYLYPTFHMIAFDIVDFQDRYHASFKNLNAAWLMEYNLMESHDMEILDDPQKHILGRDGFIYLARHGEEIIGSAALIPKPEGVFELAKMAVAKPFRNMGVSRALLEKCLAKAKALNAKKVILFSNHQLKAALGLYEKYGFRHVPVEDSPFETADVRMELEM